MHVPAFAFAILTVLGFLTPAPVWACSLDERVQTVPREGAFVPANLAGIDVWHVANYGEKTYRFFEVKQDPVSGWITDRREIVGTFDGSTFVFDGRLQAGVEIVVEEYFNGNPQSNSTFKTTRESALPETLGELSVREQTSGRLGGCWDPIPTETVEVLLDHTASAKPWQQAFVYEIVVAGHDETFVVDRFDRDFQIPRFGFETLTAVCQEDAAPEWLSERQWDFHVRATLPGTDIVLTTNSVSIDLKCPILYGNDEFPWHESTGTPGNDTDEIDAVDHGNDSAETSMGQGCATTGLSSSAPVLLFCLLAGRSRRKRI